MAFLKDRLAARRTTGELRVLAAIGMLRPSKASAWPISRLACMSPGKTFAVLRRLESRGQVIREIAPLADGPLLPRRWIYKVAKAGVRS